MEGTNNSARNKSLYRGAQTVWYVLGILEIVLIFRFFLKLFGANPAAGFSSFVYNLSWPFISPFYNVFNVTRVEGSVFEWTTLLAMAVYWLIAWGIIKLFAMNRPISSQQAQTELEREDQ